MTVPAVTLRPTAELAPELLADIELPPESAVQAYDGPVGPKQLVWIESPCHFAFYDQDPYVSQAAAAAVEWLDTHLGAGLAEQRAAAG